MPSLRSCFFSMAAGATALWLGLSLFGMTAEGHRVLAPPEVLDSEGWTMLDGDGGHGEEGFEIRGLGTRAYALAGMQLPEPLDAAEAGRIEIRFVPGGGHFDLVFGWSRSPTLSGFRRHSIAPDDDGRAVLNTADLFGWEGEIEYFLIRTRGSLDPPLVIRSIRIFSERPSFAGFQRRLVGDWFDFRSWTQVSVNRTLVGGGSPLVSPVLAAACWLLVSLIIFLALQVRGTRKRRIMGACLMVVIAWGLLDLRWQLELFHKASGTIGQYAGKNWREKRAIGIDAPEFEFMERLKNLAPEPEAGRVFILSRYRWPRLRARYHALPLPARVADDTLPRDRVRHFRSGDWLVLIAAPGIELQDEFGAEAQPAELSVAFAAEEIAGRDAVVETANDETVLVLEPTNRRLVRAVVPEAFPAGYYQARFELWAGRPDGGARLRVRQRVAGRGWVILAERDLEIAAEGFGEYRLVFPVAESGVIEIVAEGIESPGLQSRGMVVEAASGAGDWVHLWSDDTGPYLVASPVLESVHASAYEIR